MTSFKYRKQGPQFTLLSRGGREQKEERKRGGGGRVGKESVCVHLCACWGWGGGGGVVCIIQSMSKEAWIPACVGVCVYWYVGLCVSSAHMETYVCLRDKCVVRASSSQWTASSNVLDGCWIKSI